MTATSSADVARRATELYQLGFARAAIDVLEIALRNDPLAGALWRLRAVLLARQGRDEEAFADVQEAMMLTPLGHEELLVLAAGYARRGHQASAMDIFSELAADPGFPTDHWELLYNGFCTLGRWHAALMWLRRVARHRCDDDRVYFAMAHAMGRLGRPPELVLNMLRKAIDLNAGEPRYRLSLAMHLMRMNRATEAYRELAELTAESIDLITCRCCMLKALQLFIEHGDCPRAAATAARLAALGRSNQRGSQEHFS